MSGLSGDVYSLFGRLEGTYGDGTVDSLSPADLQAVEDVTQNYNQEAVKRMIVAGGMKGSKTIPTTRSAQFGAKIELSPVTLSDPPTERPPEHDFLRSSGWSEPIEIGGINQRSLIYQLQATGHGSMAVGAFFYGEQPGEALGMRSRGVRWNGSLAGASGKQLFMTLQGDGIRPVWGDDPPPNLGLLADILPFVHTNVDVQLTAYVPDMPPINFTGELRDVKFDPAFKRELKPAASGDNDGYSEVVLKQGEPTIEIETALDDRFVEWDLPFYFAKATQFSVALTWKDLETWNGVTGNRLVFKSTFMIADKGLTFNKDAQGRPTVTTKGNPMWGDAFTPGGFGVDPSMPVAELVYETWA